MKNFSHYKNNIDSILENSFKDSKEFKKNLSVIMGAMKYSKVLRETKTLTDKEETTLYLNEAFNYMKDRKDGLKKVKPILDKIIGDRKELCEERQNTIYENIDNVVFNQDVTKLGVVTESKQKLANHLVSERKKPVGKITNPKI